VRPDKKIGSVLGPHIGAFEGAGVAAAKRNESVTVPASVF
jgi:hypothetical protein